MDWIEPMEPLLRPDVITGSQWIHQIKWDGIRGLCLVEGGRLKVFTRNGRERTDFYPELQCLAGQFRAQSAWLDGEIVVLDRNGKPSFHHVLSRERRVRVPSSGNLQAGPALYMVFDIMSLDGKDLRNLPLGQRKEILGERLKPSENIWLTHDYSDGNALLDLMRQKGWEGIVSKREDSPYIGGKKHRYWYKTKLQRKLLAVVCGLSIKGSVPSSLILGIKPDNEWIYIGKASLGLTQEHFRILNENIAFLAAQTPPFPIPGNIRNAIWFKPVLTCWVSFLEWTETGSLRHPKIIGFSTLSPDQADGTEYTK